jgi:hypothetical protein
MSTAFLVGISGPARVGKDRVASYLCTTLQARQRVQEPPAIVARLSDPLKQAAKELFGFDSDAMDEEKGSSRKDTMDPRIGISPRRGLADLGILARGVNATFLVDRLVERHAPQLSNRAVHIIVPDVRFVHDIWALKSYASYYQYQTAFLHVTRVDKDYYCHHITEDIGDDPDELKRYSDVHILNNGSLTALEECIECLARELFLSDDVSK